MKALTPEILVAACPNVKNAQQFCDIININGIELAELNTPERLAMFTAQTLHESGGWKYVREIWGPTDWQKKYEGHKGLGNTEPGDGVKFKGRGLIQLTGRSNYQKFSNWIKDPSIMDHPELVEAPKYAVESACWFWASNNLNDLVPDIKKVTKRINGAKMLGLEERTKYYNKLLELLQE